MDYPVPNPNPTPPAGLIVFLVKPLNRCERVSDWKRRLMGRFAALALKAAKCRENRRLHAAAFATDVMLWRRSRREPGQ